MKRVLYFLMSLITAVNCHARVVGDLAEVAIIDRDSGETLDSHYYHGEYWVAGRPGARYAIELHNRLGERLMAVLSVDGVNVITGATAGWNQTGYVFGAGERNQISGWRKSDTEIADFTFTESSHSYAERTGRPKNVGVIGVALFREMRVVQNYAPALQEQRSEDASNKSLDRGSVAAQAPAPNAKLGTGHGEREYSSIERTEFAKLQQQPNEIIRIHYDSTENLVAMGIIRHTHRYPAAVDPFPASPGSYVPDPAG